MLKTNEILNLNTNEDIANYLYRKRKEYCLTQLEISQVTSKSRQAYRSYEKGESPIQAVDLIKIVSYFNKIEEKRKKYFSYRQGVVR